MLDGVLDWFADLLVDSLNALIKVITDILLITPDVTTLPQVQALTGRAVWIVDTCFALVFLAAGTLTMVAGGDERSRYTVKDLLPRCVVGFVASHLSQLVAGKMIELANALTAALTAQDLDQAGAIKAMREHIMISAETGGGLFVVCLAIILFLMAATCCSSVVRFIAAMALVAGGPIALACHALPQTDPIARLWWRSLAGVLAVPVLQGTVLYAAQWMLLDPDAMLPKMGMLIEPGSILNLFIVMVLLWMCVRIPSLVRRFAMEGGRSTNFLSMVIRVVAVQHLARLLPGVGGAR
ncbi:hypothetical protein BJY16_001790 [Actinoplanes octamycinicus]|uniref:TrbL/VirB6 plasmid conjugal transfer protein n=2 Tax=Actinoplanes octamycinicus TaxID=135948 RepID=A0A7W7M654_9ACTN|nr:hypothetical protein [Actinoplanes octamycinicus]